MTSNIERDFGEQPIKKIMEMHGLEATEQITYKMVARAVKGRRLTPSVQSKILNALNKASKKNYLLNGLFNY
jgi:hypothetical protein